jgi:hypothetical protein
MQLLLSSPWWFIPICLLAGFGYAYLLYKPQFKEMPYKVMAALRFLSVSLLCFFLLGPVLVQWLNEVQKPKILMVLDQSESIIANKYANFYKSDFLNKWTQAKELLGDEYEVEYLSLGSKIKISDSTRFNQKKTNISQLFDYVNNTYARENIGAVILASDGIYNRGNNPIYKSLNKNTILYTIGMGDTILKKDLLIKEANHNAIAYLNNQFPIEISISANDCINSSSNLSLTCEGKILYNSTININQKDFFKTINIDLLADKPGTMHIVANLSPIAAEFSNANNRKDIFVEVIDGREKILLAYQTTHPDIGAIKESIQTNQNYEVNALSLNEIKLSDLNLYSAVILYQLPGKNSNSRDLISSIKKIQIPVWCIVGNQTAIEQLSLINNTAKIDKNQGRMNESQAIFNSDFTAFTLDPNTISSLSDLPPLSAPYGFYNASIGTESLLYQKIGQVNTQTPLWTFSNQNGEKTAYLFGEGFWRWKLFDFVKNESHIASNELVSKTIQYLTVKEDKRKFRVYPLKNVYEEDEAVKFLAELYNSSYEPVNTANVLLSLTDANNKTYNYNFSPIGKTYQLDLGFLNPGIYTFKAKANEINETINGKLLVKPLQIELVNTKADFGLLREIAGNNSGQFYPAEKLESCIENLKKNTNITSVSYNEKRPDELINIKWIFFFLLFIISAEWFIRKYEGAN